MVRHYIMLCITLLFIACSSESTSELSTESEDPTSEEQNNEPEQENSGGTDTTPQALIYLAENGVRPSSAGTMPRWATQAR